MRDFTIYTASRPTLYEAEALQTEPIPPGVAIFEVVAEFVRVNFFPAALGFLAGMFLTVGAASVIGAFL